MMQYLRMPVILCLSIICCADVFSQGIISLESGDFENVDVTAARKQNRFGAFVFRPDGWTIVSEPENVGAGAKSLVLCNTMIIYADIPEKLRGKSLELSFLAKGDCSLWYWTGQDLTYMIEKETDGKGNVISAGDQVRPIYCNFLGWDGKFPHKYPNYTEFKICFPPLSPKTSRVEIVLEQDSRFKYNIATAPRKFYLDNVALKAYDIPFYKDYSLKPLKGTDYSFETGKWKYNPTHVHVPEGGKSVVIRENAAFRLNLPLEQLKGKSLEVMLRAKGSGKLNVSLDTGGAGMIRKTVDSASELTETETPRIFRFSEVRCDSDKLLLQIDAKDKAVISDLKINVSDRPLIPYPRNMHQIPGEVLPANYIEGRSPDLGGLVNIAPFADVSNADRYEARLNRVVDGSLGTLCKDTVEFRFKEPVRVSELRLTLPPVSMLIHADTTGAGKYDTVILEELNGLNFGTWGNLREYVWFRHKFSSPMKLYGIKYTGGCNEFQILATPKDAADIMKKNPEKALAPAPLLSLGEKTDVPDAKKEDRLRFGFCLEPWMFDVPSIMDGYYKKETPMPKVEDWKMWQKIVSDFKALNANFILLFPPHTLLIPPGATPRPGPYPAPVMWPSSVWYLNQPFNLLAEMNRSCRENDILNFVIPREWLFLDKAPKEQVVFACEIAECGSDGVPMGFDEQMIQTGCTLRNIEPVKDSNTEEQKAQILKNNEEAEAFLKKYKTQKIPSSKMDSEAVRLGHLWRLGRIAEYMAEIKKVSAEANPGSLTFGAFGGNDLRNRLSIAGPHDAWGFEGKTDVMGGDGTYWGIGEAPLGSYRPVAETADYASMSPGRRVLATLNFNWGIRWDAAKQAYRNPLVYDDYPDTALYGTVLTCFFNKAEFIDFWRYNFMDEFGGPKVRQAVASAGRMSAVLSAWGGKKAGVPKDVLVLRSRTSEDWWYLKQEFLPENMSVPVSGREWFQDAGHRSGVHVAALKEQGFNQFDWLVSQLVGGSVPFEVYLMNRPEAYRDIITKYKVIILPFPYAVSVESAALLKKAADNGVKIISLSGCGQGAVDELGELHKDGPILDQMVKAGYISVFDIDVINGKNTMALQESFGKLLAEKFGANGPSVKMQRHGMHDVQCFMLDVSKTEKLVLLVNYSGRDTSVNLSVKMPKGTYRMQVCTIQDVRAGLIGGKTSLSENELENFRIELPREDAKILRIFR